MMAARGLLESWKPWPTTYELRTVRTRLGILDSSIVYPVSPKTPTCYDCERPLHLFIVTRIADDLPRGYCTGCTMRRFWIQEHKQDRTSQSREDYLHGQEEKLLRAWNRQSVEWWETQRKAQTPTYRHWLQRREQSSPTPTSNPAS
jgi:hypothetical protein